MADRSLEKEFDVLKNDLGSLKDDVATIAKLLAKKGSAQLSEAVDNGKARVQAGVGVLEDQVTARPLTSLLLAFGIGIMLGKITHR
ncbi:hypothetical protein [Dongia mobilis]|jgi:ElaB/YqjD/DUF883 family membrane-anchored ribosome-binding protein|uniref:hypothetical protein n=1 Tax=Dongia sp. TaxID=1977262 RepID=UPI0026EA5717